MKYIRIFVVAIFIAMMFVPLLCMNTQPEVASEIDNRMLAENPFSPEVRNREDADLTDDIDSYLSDRIGFRDEMLLANTVINDSLFGKMDHPTYAYGKDGYVFFSSMVPEQMSDYHIAFADMVEAVQNYCHERGVPFVFAFDPEKKSVYNDFLPQGVHYNNDWVSEFLAELDKRNINYVDNTQILVERKNEGEAVFNQKYNAGHWNDLGAFYGVNNILKSVQQFFPEVHLNEQDEFDIEYVLNTSLQVSQFPIHEEEPVFTVKHDETENLTELYREETKMNEQYRAFIYTVNEAQKQNGSPKTLVFQGSYMNGMGYKFFENSLGEYIAVHDYQNILNLPYYFNLYQPECVIFEVAEYTFSSTYFDYETMQSIHWNPELVGYVPGHMVNELQRLSADAVSVERGNVFTTIRWNAEQAYDYVWLIAGGEFDMALVDPEQNLYEASIPNENFDQSWNDLYIIDALDDQMNPYQIRNLTVEDLSQSADEN